MILNVCAGMPSEIANIISKVINIIKIVVPVGLVIFGMLDFAKATWAQKDEEIAKGKNTFFKRLISGALVFFVIAIVQLVFNLLDTNGSNEAISCLNSILNGTGGTSYEGGSGGGKTSYILPDDCSERGIYNNQCASDGKCQVCGNVSMCVPKGTNCNELTTTKNVIAACNFIENKYGTEYKTCEQCVKFNVIEEKYLKNCVAAGGYKQYEEKKDEHLYNCGKEAQDKYKDILGRCIKYYEDDDKKLQCEQMLITDIEKYSQEEQIYWFKKDYIKAQEEYEACKKEY